MNAQNPLSAVRLHRRTAPTAHRLPPTSNLLLRSQPLPDGESLRINTINRRNANGRWTRCRRERLNKYVFHRPPPVGITSRDDFLENVMEGPVLNLRHEHLSRDAERSCDHGRVGITTLRLMNPISASDVCKLRQETHQAMCTGRIVHPYPIWAVVGQPVLAPVLVITTGAGHVEGLLPAGSKAF